MARPVRAPRRLVRDPRGDRAAARAPRARSVPGDGRQKERDLGSRSERDGFVRAIVDPYVNALHRWLLRGRRSLEAVDPREASHARRAGSLGRAGGALATEGAAGSLARLRSECEELHRRVWELPSARASPTAGEGRGRGRESFPKGFLWGSATSAHQVEGNCDHNHWWAWEQEGLRAEPRGGRMRDGSVSGIACDYYHRFDEDHRLAADARSSSLGFRSSGAGWSRSGSLRPAAMDHYKRVCDSMLRTGLEPTADAPPLHEPMWAQHEGGWENPRMSSWLARFAAYRGAGDRRPSEALVDDQRADDRAALGYLLGIHPPCVRDPGAGAAGGAQHASRPRRELSRDPRGARHPIEVGAVLAMPYFEPLDPDSESDRPRRKRATGS